MRQMKASSLSCCAVMTMIASMPVSLLHAADIEPPKAQVTDKFGVNMANGQVTHSLDTVSIGGAMGLSDSISVFANEFNFLGYRGFNYKYFAQARNVELSTQASYSPRNVMRVYDPSGSADFAYYVGSTIQQSGQSLISGYSYKPVGDERHSLEVSGNDLLWIKPDGTEVRFTRPSSPTAASTSLLREIKYPNGFTITVTAGGMSVNTNTGFQLKAIYEADTRPMEKTDNPNLINVPPYTTSASSGWSNMNPKYIKGINAAIKYCAWSVSTCDDSEHDWPTAQFLWPAGMPRTMFIGTSAVDVVNAQGLKTTYRFQAYDLAYNGSVVVPPYVPGTEFSPRLVGISPPGSAEQFTYDYKNLFATINMGDMGAYDVRLQASGVVKSATRQGLSVGYDMLQQYYNDSINYANGPAPNGVSQVQLRGTVQGATGALNTATTADGVIYFESSPRNFPTHFDKYSEPREDYEYTRSNLTKITYNTTAFYVAAEYPASCTSSTRKTCNQATRTRDANGNWTDYTYHTQSGQLASVTAPANKNGLRAQTRYEYTQLSAHYYDNTGAKITGTPIWMKTAEKTCMNSASTGNACSGNDEVVTRYEYDNDNLLMTGMTVTDPVSGATLRTCFQYDIYGNQIGKTQPKAGLTQCN